MKSIINILNEALAKDVKIPQKAYVDFENALSDTSKVFVKKKSLERLV